MGNNRNMRTDTKQGERRKNRRNSKD